MWRGSLLFLLHHVIHVIPVILLGSKRQQLINSTLTAFIYSSRLFRTAFKHFVPASQVQSWRVVGGTEKGRQHRSFLGTRPNLKKQCQVLLHWVMLKSVWRDLDEGTKVEEKDGSIYSNSHNYFSQIQLQPILKQLTSGVFEFKSRY